MDVFFLNNCFVRYYYYKGFLLAGKGETRGQVAKFKGGNAPLKIKSRGASKYVNYSLLQ
jgi:hypothetical protein